MSAAEELSGSGRLRRADLRMSDERLRRYQQAAALEGASFSAFALRALDAAAEETFRRHRTITLSEEAMRAFVEDLLNPGEPGERLKRYAQMHHTLERLNQVQEAAGEHEGQAAPI